MQASGSPNGVIKVLARAEDLETADVIIDRRGRLLDIRDNVSNRAVDLEQSWSGHGYHTAGQVT